MNDCFPPGNARPVNPADELTDDAITDTFRLYQRRRGHRYSIDDIATAWEAVHTVTAPKRCLDMGCGIGSVLHVVAYRFPEASLVGIEAQDVSFELVQKNVARNGLSSRVRLIHGDLREVRLEERFDLVTGTPPYVPIGKSIPSPDSQRKHARVEMRGGVEEYLHAGGRVLAPGGRLVVCCDARTPSRVMDTAQAAGLQVLRRRDFVPRQGKKDSLFTVWTFGLLSEGGEFETMPPFIVRDESGKRTLRAHDLRNFVGMPHTDAD